jgi:D-glycero-alpha-D-manno-heptose 1-phosphate guanylyltransferase
MSSKLDAIILAGGKGTRLASVVSTVPKPLALVAGRPFLDHLLGQLACSGIIDRAVLALGHLAEKVIAHYKAHPAPLPLEAVTEETPLGTGGALIRALSHVSSTTLLVCNGDSIAKLDLMAMLAHHRATGGMVTLAVLPMADCARYGTVTLSGNRVTEFVEKQPGHGLINTGIYLIERSAFDDFLPGPLSLERDILPGLVDHGLVVGFNCGAVPFIDIGLPETYAGAAEFLNRFDLLT